MSRRDDAWLRPKRYLGVGHPDAGKDGYEKWVYYTATVPPELAAEIDAAQRDSLGVNATERNATRANAVRAGLRLYLNAVAPEADPPVDGTAVEIVELRELVAGAGPHEG